MSSAVPMRKVGDRIPHRIGEVVEAVEVERGGVALCSTGSAIRFGRSGRASPIGRALGSWA